MSDIELHERYPLSRREDITDAYMRGVEYGRKLMRGTCRMERDNAWSSDYEWHCTECREHVSICNEPPHFCPNCGRKVVDE